MGRVSSSKVARQIGFVLYFLLKTRACHEARMRRLFLGFWLCRGLLTCASQSQAFTLERSFRIGGTIRVVQKCQYTNGWVVLAPSHRMHVCSTINHLDLQFESIIPSQPEKKISAKITIIQYKTILYKLNKGKKKEKKSGSFNSWKVVWKLL